MSNATNAMSTLTELSERLERIKGQCRNDGARLRRGIVYLIAHLEEQARHDSLPELTSAYRALKQLCDLWEAQ